jgi:hypothetical protein
MVPKKASRAAPLPDAPEHVIRLIAFTQFCPAHPDWPSERWHLDLTTHLRVSF